MSRYRTTLLTILAAFAVSPWLASAETGVGDVRIEAVNVNSSSRDDLRPLQRCGKSNDELNALAMSNRNGASFTSSAAFLQWLGPRPACPGLRFALRANGDETYAVPGRPAR